MREDLSAQAIGQGLLVAVVGYASSAAIVIAHHLFAAQRKNAA